MDRPSKPKRLYPGIACSWSAGWKWRAVWRDASGKQCRGGVRVLQEDAYQDYRARVPRGKNASEPVELEDALWSALARAEARGVGKRTLEGYRKLHVTLCRLVGGETDLRGVGADEVLAIMRKARKQGYSASTVRTKILFALGQAFRATGLPPDPVREATKQGRTMLRARSLPPPIPEGEDVEEFLRRMRAYQPPRGSDGRAVHCRSQTRDADVLELAAFTGLRWGEIARLQVGDVNLGRRELRVVEPKDPGQPRVIPVAERLVEPLSRLMRGKRRGETLVHSTYVLDHIARTWSLRLGVRLNLRQLRHSFATGLLETGAHIAEVRDLLGHRNTSAITSRYLHTTDKRRAAAITRLESRHRSAPHPETATNGSQPGTPPSGPEGSPSDER